MLLERRTMEETDGQKREIDREYLITTVQELAEELGRPPKTTHVREHDSTPTYRTYRNEFDSWSEALEAADLTDEQMRPARDRTNKELVQDLRRVDEQTDGRLTFNNYKKAHKNGDTITTPETISNRLGTWNDALDAAGLKTTHRGTKVSRDKILTDLQRVAAKLGKEYVTANEYDEHGEYSDSLVNKRFESWRAANKEAGLKPEEQN